MTWFAKVDESRPRRRIRLLAILGLVALLAGGGRLAAPGIEARIRLHVAGRELDAGRLDAAQEQLDLLISDQPARTEPRLLLARVARRRGRMTEAEEILQRAIDLGLPVDEARPEHDRIRAGDESH